MAPGGQRMPELSSITLLEQQSQKRRMLRIIASQVTISSCQYARKCHAHQRARFISISQICIIADYLKGEGFSDMEVGYWLGDTLVTCHILRIVIMLKPILHTLATNLNDPDATMIPYVFATESIRQIGDTYNWLLKSAELPSCRYIRHVKVCWAMECALRVQESSASKMYNAAALFLNHTPATAEHHYALNPDIILQAQQAVCEEYHKFVLGGAQEQARIDLESQQGDAHYPDDFFMPDFTNDPDYINFDDSDFCENSWASVAQTLGIDSFRPLQTSALKIIENGFHASQTEKKLATVAIVTPTSSGKDLLPLAWAVFRSQVAVMFAPFKHLQDEAYANRFHCVSEVFHKGMENTAAHLLICAYENSEFVSNAIEFIMLLFDVYGQIVPLLQTMMSSGRLAAIFVNEAQVLYVDESWRMFDGMKAVFQTCTRLGIWCVVVFMTATLKRPKKVLEFCGFSFPFDESLIVSPMRDNLSITLKCHPEGSTEQTSVKAMFKSACEFINRVAPGQRVLIFVLYKNELGKLERLFKAKYPRRPIVLYSREIRPDLSVIADDAIIISTSVLQTGANPPPIKLVVHWGHAFSVEALLQGAGRAGRNGEQGHAVLLSTPHAIQEVLRIYKNAQGLVDVRDLIRKGNDLQLSLTEYFDPEVIMSHSGAARQADRSTQSFSRIATHTDMIVLQRALQVFCKL